jgi:electron transport complex protein RnfG
MNGNSGRMVFKSAAALGLVAVLGTALLAAVHQLTAGRIEAQERRVVEQQLGQILPASEYDNDLLHDTIELQDEAYFPRGQVVTAYRARRDSRPVAVIFRFKAVDGYSGDIHLLAGTRYDGTLAGVRVVTHRETPGLGDAIEVEKSDWVLGFNGASLRDPGPGGWAVKRDGGQFDQFTGATITPRAVVDAVRSALEYYRLNRERVFRQAATTPTDDTVREP